MENSLKWLFADSSDHGAKIDPPQSSFNAIELTPVKFKPPESGHF
ncbi:MAG TPA: hypothetical protein VGP09_09640 [Caballeronia sp.]|nr:hypothetical protein [Caballeronia sp.]